MKNILCIKCRRFFDGTGDMCPRCRRAHADHSAHVGNMVTPRPSVTRVTPPANIRDERG